MAELTAGAPGSAEAVFHRQVEAFNARDLEGFLATYSTDAIVFGVTGPAPLTGRAELRVHYRARFDDPLLHCEPLDVVEWPGGWVIARERITSSGGVRDVVAMFAVDDGVINRSFIGL